IYIFIRRCLLRTAWASLSLLLSPPQPGQYMHSGQSGKTPSGNVGHGAIGIEIDRQRRRYILSLAGSGNLFVKKQPALLRLFLGFDD
ncbi:hypothetical protein QMZ20_03855, partial [Serratia bockelmannii]|nr:hypothetical protein [Serratia bockelmannii]